MTPQKDNMASMNKHPYLTVEMQSSVKMTPAQIKKLQQWLKWASESLEDFMEEGAIPQGKMTGIQVSLLICGEARIKKLNSEYRQKDKVTDVLSFPHHESLRNKKPEHSGVIFLGDLAICHQKTAKQAKEFSISYWDEFIHLFFHGILHLMGFDHEISLKEEKLMEKWEDRLLTIFSTKKKGA
jgi:probable rRNA maturation factor